MSDAKVGWNQDMKEYLHPSTHPYSDRSQFTEMDTSDGLTIDISRIDFYSNNTLLKAARIAPLDTTDIKQIKSQLIAAATNYFDTAATNPQEYPPLYLINYSPGVAGMVDTKTIEKFRGRVHVGREVWYNGLLIVKTNYDSEGYPLDDEVWSPKGYLVSRGFFIPNPPKGFHRIGPLEKWSNDLGYREYYLNGEKVSKQDWDNYLTETRQTVIKNRGLITDVSALVAAYTAF